jgi:Spy/CpxP family protein refolding chaperone
MLRRDVLIAGMLVVLGSIAMTASAQPPGGPGGGVPGGGMFMIRGGGPGAMLLRIAEVQRELNLSSEQKQQIETLLADAVQKVRVSLGQVNFQDLQTLSEEERQKRFDEMRKNAEEATKGIDEKVGKILNEEQGKRLKQLQLQREGAMALNRPEVIQKLALTADQQAQIKQIQEAARPAGGPRFDPKQTDEERQTAVKKIREKREKAQKDCFAVLNDDQMLDWTKMCGKTFKFPERPAFPGRNRQNPPPKQP